MEKKFTKRLMLMGLCGTAVTLALCVLVFFTVFERQAAQDVRIYSDVITASYYQNGHSLFNVGVDSSDLRVTLIGPDGTVLFDNEVSGRLENHLDRPEVRDALSQGEGHAERRSDTTRQNAYYYAVRLDDGNILRVASDLHSRFDLFRSAIPVLLVCCLIVWVLGWLLSLLLTRQLVQPIVQMGNRLDELDRDVPYPELQPFVDAIVRDRETRRQSETMRQEFTANVSHELKTPLTSISGYAELIETGMAKPEDVAHFAQKIRKESARLLNLVNDILQLSKLDAAQEALRGQAEAEFELLDLKDVVSACADNLAVNAQRAYVTLLCDAEHTPVMGSRSSLDELCINLCDNAIRYNRPGGKVILSCGTADGRPYLRVRDNGIGIPEEQHQRVFERFYRVDKSRSKETGGTGLGLAIVKHIAAIHSAQIELHSAVGRGTDIRVIFRNVKK